ncbi:MAG: hypothetical protein ACRD6X_00020 [Pyrinomonadaceae bacterium]
MNEEILQDAGNETDDYVPEVSESNAEAEQLRAEILQLKDAIRMRDAREAFTKELKAQGARSPELLFASVENQIQFDDEGKPANVAAVTANLKQRFPEQFGYDNPASIDAGAGRANQNDFLTRDSLAKMKPQEIARLDWNDVRQVLSN